MRGEYETQPQAHVEIHCREIERTIAAAEIKVPECGSISRSVALYFGIDWQANMVPPIADIPTSLPSALHFRRRQIWRRYKPRDPSDVRRQVVF